MKQVTEEAVKFVDSEQNKSQGEYKVFNDVKQISPLSENDF